MSAKTDVVDCPCSGLHPAGPFTGWSDFSGFANVLRETEWLTEVPVAKSWSNVGLTEHWYQCAKCKSAWRLVEPDPPFAGLWERVA
jgi:hypothetical protein